MSDKRWLLADIGGTHSRLALWQSGGLNPSRPTVFVNANYGQFDALVQEFLHSCPAPAPEHALLAVAGPVISQSVYLTNRGWRIASTELAASCRLDSVYLLNDFTAVGWCLPSLAASDLVKLGEGEPVPGAPMAVLGPGTGLGVSGLSPHRDGWLAITGEGGHVTLAASSAEEDNVLQRLRATYGHVSAERVLSGPGLVDLYSCVADIAGQQRRWHRPEDVTANAAADPLARATLDLFFKFLGTVAGDLALTLGAQGGVFLAGGLVPRLVPALQASMFRTRFTSKGRFSAYLERIPTYLIVHPHPGLEGLKSFIQQQRF